MVERARRASLSKSQEREGWSIIFRHPVRIDPTTGKPGRRVRRGLGTRDREQATKLVDQMNEVLADPTYWEVSARPRAEALFDKSVAEIFYHELQPEVHDFFALRESVIRLPSSENSEYRRVMLVGTTGGGKTTLVRQLLGTDPRTERFPAISTAKTTVADMEIVLSEGRYRAVVTFLPRDQVRDYVEESISSAVLAAYQDGSDAEISRRLLNHVSQRFRLNYVLGNSGTPLAADDIDDEDDDAPSASLVTVPAIDLQQTNIVLHDAVTAVRQIAATHGHSLRTELGATESDARIIEEIFEENLDYILREDEVFHVVADQLMDEIGRRFDFLSEGAIEKTKQGWPRLWRWETEDRAAFLKAVSRFSSNHTGYFGTLLTPLVNGIRIAGPFKPDWLDEQPLVVLLDGEGLGHTPESSASLPTVVAQRFEEVDAVLLVDSATQPMQTAPVAVMRHLAAAGKTDKLIICFTHLDAVGGDNLLGSFQAKEQHVLASVENVLPAIGQQLGPFAERALRKRVKLGCFFVGGINQRLDETSKRGLRSVERLCGLLAAFTSIVKRPQVIMEARAAYDRMNLVMAVREATESFHSAWSARLGHVYRPDISKAHWATVKALTRRFAEGWADEWAGLRPVADLYGELQDKIYVFIQNPVGWDPASPTDDEKQQVFDRFADAISSRVRQIAARKIGEERVREWQDAYALRGRGSTFVRASIIKEEVYGKAAPVPGITPSPGRNDFLHEVTEAVRAAAERWGIVLL